MDDDRRGTLIIEDETLRHGFVQLPKPILYARNLTAEAKLLYAILLGYAWQEESCYPGMGRLCDDMGLSEKTVHKHMEGLIHTGLLAVQRRGQGKTNIYTLKSLRTVNSTVLEPEQPVPIQNRKFYGSRAGDFTDKVESVEVETVEEESEDEVSNLSPLDFSIEPHVRSVAAELHDEAPLKSSIKRALNLWAETDLSAEEFVAAMGEAKKRTQKYSSGIRKKAVGDGLLPTKNKMPYWFKVLEELVAGK